MSSADPPVPGGIVGKPASLDVAALDHAAAPADLPFSPAPDEPGNASVFGCPLCGMRFAHGGLACSACPLNLGCEIVHCPNCGFQFPRSSRLVDWARRWLRRARGDRS